MGICLSRRGKKEKAADDAGGVDMESVYFDDEGGELDDVKPAEPTGEYGRMSEVIANAPDHSSLVIESLSESDDNSAPKDASGVYAAFKPPDGDAPPVVYGGLGEVSGGDDSSSS